AREGLLVLGEEAGQHGMCSTLKDRVNADLLAFIKPRHGVPRSDAADTGYASAGGSTSRIRGDWVGRVPPASAAVLSSAPRARSEPTSIPHAASGNAASFSSPRPSMRAAPGWPDLHLC